MAFDVSFVLIDAYGRTTRRTYGNNRVLMADVLTDVTAMTSALEAISGSAVQKVYISSVQVVASPAPDTGANNDAGATLHAVMDNAKMVGVKVPAFDVTKINADGSVMLADSDVAAFIALFATAAHWRISEGNYITSLKYGELDR